MNLYELTENYLYVQNMLEDEEVDEQTIKDTLESIQYEIEDKADNYAKIIKNLEMKIAGIETEIKRLTDRKKILENRIKWLKENLKESMEKINKRKLSTELFSFNIQKNGGKRKLVLDVEVDKLPEEFRIKQPDNVNGDLLREYLDKVGQLTTEGKLKCEYAHLEPQGESLRIK